MSRCFSLRLERGAAILLRETKLEFHFPEVNL
jgi:hypothetical protein